MRRVLAIAFIFLLIRCSCSSEASKTPYRLGNFASTPTSSLTRPKTSSLLSVKSIITNVSQLWNQYARYLRLCVFIYYTRESVDSILEDTWEAVRDPDRVFGQQIRRVGERKVVMRRTRKSEALRALVGAGYTPRLVWLFGVMLRGIVHCTALPQVFSPPIGFGSGAVADKMSPDIQTDDRIDNAWATTAHSFRNDLITRPERVTSFRTSID
jgi:hypothetical protein